jgi:formylglycine-generating enzyme required for sulfatase activity
MDLIPFEYEVVTVDEQGTVYQRSLHQNVYFAEDLGDGVLLKMVRVPGGSFQMGATPDDTEQFLCKVAEPRHMVTLSSFLMGMTPVTQAQFQAVMGHNPSSFRPDRPYYPVNTVSWSEAMEFCERLSALTGRSYRLSSEAEWEYACRAGTTTAFHFGPTVTETLLNYGEDYRYILEPSQRRFHNPEQEAPTLPVNAFGLYDLHYSVWEWCADHWHDSYDNASEDGSAWIDHGESTQRVLRGGPVQAFPHASRSSERNCHFIDTQDGLIGFRVCCSTVPLESVAESSALEGVSQEISNQAVQVYLSDAETASAVVQFFQSWLEPQSITDCLREVDRILLRGEVGLRGLAQKLSLPPLLKPFEYETFTVNPQGQMSNRTQRQNVYFEESLGVGVTLNMVLIPGGTFWMGTESNEIEWLCDFTRNRQHVSEGPHHQATVSSFAIAMTPITRRQFQAVMGRLPDELVEQELTSEEQDVLRNLQEGFNADFEQWVQQDENQTMWASLEAQLQELAEAEEQADRLQEEQRQHYPVERVSWQDALEFCERLTALTGRPYRLPSEAEWEYACRANTETPFYFGETITTDLANYYGVDEDIEGWGTRPGHYNQGPIGIYRGAVTDVGLFPPNEFGLYDMHGTVWEWCANDWHQSYDGAPSDGSSWLTGTNVEEKVLRGGAWNALPSDCRSSSRRSLLPSNAHDGIGFRVCLALTS